MTTSGFLYTICFANYFFGNMNIAYYFFLNKGRLQIQGEKALTEYQSSKAKNVIPYRGMAGTAIGIGNCRQTIYFLP